MIIPHMLAVAAILAGSEVVTMEIGQPRLVVRHALPGSGAAVFVAPDGVLLVPLAGHDATARIPPGGTAEIVSGRVFPVFHDEADRMLVVLSDGVAVLSYPERLELRRIRLELSPVWRVAVTRDGQILAVLTGAPRPELVLVDMLGGGVVGRLEVDVGCRSLAMEPRAGWVAVGCADGGVRVLRGALAVTVSMPVAGAVTSLAAAEDGRTLYAGLTAADGQGTVVAVRVPERTGEIRILASSMLPRGVTALATSGDSVLAGTDQGVHVLARRRLRPKGMVELSGVRDLVVFPEAYESLVPTWSDGAVPAEESRSERAPF